MLESDPIRLTPRTMPFTQQQAGDFARGVSPLLGGPKARKAFLEALGEEWGCVIHITFTERLGIGLEKAPDVGYDGGEKGEELLRGGERGGKKGEKPAGKRSQLGIGPSVSADEISRVASLYSVSEKDVLATWDTLKDYCEAHGKRYSSYPAALRNFVRGNLERGRIKRLPAGMSPNGEFDASAWIRTERA